jgi:hypothetical protein
LVRGDTLLQTLAVTQTGFDFTGTTARCQVKRTKNASMPIATINPILAFPELGKMTVTLRLNYPDTNWQPITYYADVELTFLGNIRKTVAFLEIQAVQDVST